MRMGTGVDYSTPICGIQTMPLKDFGVSPHQVGVGWLSMDCHLGHTFMTRQDELF